MSEATTRGADASSGCGGGGEGTLPAGESGGDRVDDDNGEFVDGADGPSAGSLAALARQLSAMHGPHSRDRQAHRRFVPQRAQASSCR